MLSCATSRSIPFLSRYSTRHGRHCSLDPHSPETQPRFSAFQLALLARGSGECNRQIRVPVIQATFLSHHSHDEERGRGCPHATGFVLIAALPTSGNEVRAKAYDLNKGSYPLRLTCFVLRTPELLIATTAARTVTPYQRVQESTPVQTTHHSISYASPHLTS